jgi:hypothetical protein
MAFTFTRPHRTTCKILLVCLGAIIVADHARAAAVNMRAHYEIYMTRVRVGEIVWAFYFADQTYQTSANGKASGVFSVLISGEGSVSAHGIVSGGKLQPTKVATTVIDDDGRVDVQMTLDAGEVKHIDDHGPPPSAGRVRVAPARLHQVTDPLSGMLVPVGSDAFARANCDRTLRIFDGRRRYNLALSYKRLDQMDVARGYSGKVLVCGVVLRPIAGHDPDSTFVRYLAGKTDLELWFAPVAGAGVIAPVRALMPTLIGTLEIRAIEFAPVGVKSAH